MSATEQGINVKAVERIVSPAIEFCGNIYTGVSHARIIEDAAKVSRTLLEPRKCGFTTSTSRFVNREEAFKIAKNSGQLKDQPIKPGELYSQDLKGEK